MNILVCPDIDISGVDIEKVIDMLPLMRREHVLLSKSNTDRLNGAVAFFLLKMLMKTYSDSDENLDFTYEGTGKPYFIFNDRIKFSLSHCRGAAVAVISTFECGIDILDKRPIRKTLENMICCENELRFIDNCNDREKQLRRMFCIKESRSKMTGKGFSEGFKCIDTTVGEDFFYECDDFVLSASGKDCAGAKLDFISLSELLSYTEIGFYGTKMGFSKT